MSKIALQLKLSSRVLLAVLLVAGGFLRPANAELTELDDGELSEHVGQAVFAFDVDETASTTYTRLTVGLNTEYQINVDELDLGNYATGDALSSDVNITKLGFGSIDTTTEQIVPFIANDPYFEIAENSAGELAGFRMGFNEAQGQLSGDLNSVSGNIGMEVVDHFGQAHQTTLLDSNGQVDKSRATHIGVDPAATGPTTSCEVATYCYDLAEFKALEVGQRNATTGDAESTKDFFIAFQKEDLEWTTSAGSINAAMGAFINIPTSMQLDANTIDLNGGAYGTSRARTEFIDRGVGLF